MKSLLISLSSVDKIKNFNSIISGFEGEFDLVLGRYIVDAKSIMGIFSLDLTKNIRLDVYNDAVFDDVKEKIQDFIVNEG